MRDWPSIGVHSRTVVRCRVCGPDDRARDLGVRVGDLLLLYRADRDPDAWADVLLRPLQLPTEYDPAWPYHDPLRPWRWPRIRLRMADLGLLALRRDPMRLRDCASRLGLLLAAPPLDDAVDHSALVCL